MPSLKDGNVVITQSLAIIDYLEDKYPQDGIYPIDPIVKAQVKAFALTIACDIHPLNNSSVIKYLKETFAISEEKAQKWYAHWIISGFHALEEKLKKSAGKYCFGDDITLADICLIPQVYNAKRFNVEEISAFPIINRIYYMAMTHPAFIAASPESVVAIEHE